MPAGRVVRCAKCKHSWKEGPPEVDTPVVDGTEAEGPVSPAEESPSPAKGTAQDADEDDFAVKRARRKKRPRPMPKGSNLPALQNHNHGGILWGWYGLAAFVAIIISSFLIFQSTIADVWPPSQKLYRALGMEIAHEAQNKPESDAEIPPEELFKITNTVLNKVRTGKVTTLTVEGNIENRTDKTIPLPLLRISLKGDQGKVIREWTFKSSAATISKGEIVPFATSLANPPDAATSISVTFARK